MEAFASIEDLEARWRELSPSEEQRATTLLDDATAILMAEFKIADVAIDDEDELQAANLKVVCCSMVKRALGTMNSADYSQASMTVGSFSKSYTMANPSGDMYLSSQERRILGLPKRRVKIGSIMPKIGRGSDE